MWTEEEKKNLPKKYNCQLIYASASLEQANDKSLPRDAYLIYYKDQEGNLAMDVCRCSKKVNLFWEDEFTLRQNSYKYSLDLQEASL